MKKKICVITGSRAEYGLLYPLLKKLKSDKEFKLKIVACGMHLSPEFGLTYREIEKDGFNISEKLQMLLSGDTEIDISKSMGIGMIGFADIFNRLKPDMLIVLGDRFEIFSSVLAAFIAKIPIAHIHGGELSEGVIDDALRHSITKMSFLHFTSTEEHKKRVIQLGESPERVFNVGALGMDSIRQLKLLSKAKLEKELGFKFSGCNLLVTFHPVTLEKDTVLFQFKELLKAISTIKNTGIIFTKPNADTGGRVIIKLIDNFVLNNPDRAISFVSLGQLKYLSTIQYVDAVIGNSSSGIIEVPAFGKPTVNIGDRQKGRIKAKSIIDCKPKAKDIKRAIDRALSKEFQYFCKTIKSPYGNGYAAEKIVKTIQDNIGNMKNLKKTFYNLQLRNTNEKKK